MLPGVKKFGPTVSFTVRIVEKFGKLKISTNGCRRRLPNRNVREICASTVFT